MHDAANPAVQSRLSRAWRWARIAFATVLALYIGLVIYRIPFVAQKDKSDAVVAKIRAQRLSMSDVDGAHLPPPPDPALADATIEGVDANRNGIRDDVELAIFKKYPRDAKLRAAELQYAMTLQLYLTSVFSSDTLVAVIHQDERASLCIGDAIAQPVKNASDKEWDKFFAREKLLQREVEDWVNSTYSRKARHDAIFAKYITSYSSSNSEEPHCDIR